MQEVLGKILKTAEKQRRIAVFFRAGRPFRGQISAPTVAKLHAFAVSAAQARRKRLFYANFT